MAYSVPKLARQHGYTLLPAIAKLAAWRLAQVEITACHMARYGSNSYAGLCRSALFGSCNDFRLAQCSEQCTKWAGHLYSGTQ